MVLHNLTEKKSLCNGYIISMMANHVKTCLAFRVICVGLLHQIINRPNDRLKSCGELWHSVSLRCVLVYRC